MVDRIRQQVLDKGEAQLAERKTHRPTPIDNSALPAGSPMTFYCVACGAVADIKPEEYLFPVRKLCSECEGLANLKLLRHVDEAQR